MGNIKRFLLCVALINISLLSSINLNERTVQPLQVEIRQRRDEFRALPKKAPVEFKVKNVSTQKQQFWVMGCSFEDHWNTDNESVKVNRERECDKNAPVLKVLEPNQSYEGLLTVLITSDRNLKFRLSFSPFKENVHDQVLDVFWSNQIEIKVAR
jgi:hypothetical protein